jgi:hypothetical protein
LLDASEVRAHLAATRRERGRTIGLETLNVQLDETNEKVVAESTR